MHGALEGNAKTAQEILVNLPAAAVWKFMPVNISTRAAVNSLSVGPQRREIHSTVGDKGQRTISGEAQPKLLCPLKNIKFDYILNHDYENDLINTSSDLTSYLHRQNSSAMRTRTFFLIKGQMCDNHDLPLIAR